MVEGLWLRWGYGYFFQGVLYGNDSFRRAAVWGKELVLQFRLSGKTAGRQPAGRENPPPEVLNCS